MIGIRLENYLLYGWNYLDLSVFSNIHLSRVAVNVIINMACEVLDNDREITWCMVRTIQI